MLELLQFIDYLLNLYVFIVLVAVVMSWLVAFDVVNRRNPAVRMIGDLLYHLTEPVLRPIRRRLPSFGGLDISPIVLILGIVFIQMVILPNLAKLFR
ncbi:MAG: YggT family protein [Bradyrhizobiaceae bacterium]|nr:YggT family protein [Bradyrhizobiaceae bacterium]